MDGYQAANEIGPLAGGRQLENEVSKVTVLSRCAPPAHVCSTAPVRSPTLGVSIVRLLRPLSGARLKRCAATLIQAKIGRISGEKNRIMDDELARALATLTTGIYVLTVAVGVHRHGMSSSWVTQVSGVPALFSAAVDNQHLSRSLITRTATLGLNIVGRRGKALEDYFYSPQAKREDNLDGLDYELSPILHVPWLKAAMAWIEAEVKHSFVVGDHTLFVAEPVGLRLGAGDRPLTSLDLDYVYVGGKKVIPRDRSGW